MGVSHLASPFHRVSDTNFNNIFDFLLITYLAEYWKLAGALNSLPQVVLSAEPYDLS